MTDRFYEWTSPSGALHRRCDCGGKVIDDVCGQCKRSERVPLQPLVSHERAAVLVGRAGDLELPENSVDALVFDPPAGIGFMAKGWDSDKGGRDIWIRWLQYQLEPAYRALKPGGHGLVWAQGRTSHWTATAIENIGAEIRTRIGHIFLTGNPKGLKRGEPGDQRCTCLKEACEDWYLFRKPLDGTVADNEARWGTGMLTLDRCRVGCPSAGGSRDGEASADARYTDSGSTSFAKKPGARGGDALGKWPAHIMIDDDVDLGFDAAKYFYVPKPTGKERDAGLEHLPIKSGGEATGRVDGSKGVANPRAGAGRGGKRRNSHPTVKSVDLMRYLCRLVTPVGGVVLDPFAGSGTTGVAALAEGFRFVGVELGGDSGEYLPIIKGRIEHALKESGE